MIKIHDADPDEQPRRCGGCSRDETAQIEMAFAFQPIVDLTSGSAYAHEALVRGPNGESAALVLAQVDDANRYSFDQRCRTTAIAQAAEMEMSSFLSINFMQMRSIKLRHASGVHLKRPRSTAFLSTGSSLRRSKGKIS